MMNTDKESFKKKIGTGQRQYLYGRHAGTTRDIPVRCDDTGRLAATQTEHWSGRMDANVYAPAIEMNLSDMAKS